MSAEITEIAPCRKKIAVTLGAEKVEAAFEEVYRQVRDMAQIPGFRRGHAPRRALERRFAKEVTRDVRGKLVEDGLREACETHDIHLLGEPELDLEQLVAEPGKPFAFSTEVDVRPKFELPAYKGLALTDPAKPIADGEVAAELERLREAFANQNPVDGAAAAGDTLHGALVAVAGGKEIANNPDAPLPVSSEALFGIPKKDLPALLTGAKAGEEKKFSLATPADDARPELRSQTIEVTFRIARITRPELPVLDEAFAARLGQKDLEELRSRLRQRLEAGRKVEARRELEEAAKTALIAAAPFAVPAELLKRMAESQITRAQLHLARLGASEQMLEEKKAEIEKAGNEGAEKQLRWRILSETIAETEKVEVSEAELWRHIEMLAQHEQMTPEQMLKKIRSMNAIPALASEIRDMKVMQIVIDAAQVSPATPS